MQRPWIILIIAAASAFCSMGCENSRVVERGSRDWGGYQAGCRYEILRSVALIHDGSDHWHTGAAFYLVPRAHAEDVQKSRPADALQGTLDPGTRIEVNRMIAYHSNALPGYWVDLLRPIARILDGPHAGQEVDLAEISKHRPAHNPDADLAWPAPEYLRPLPDRRIDQLSCYFIIRK